MLFNILFCILYCVCTKVVAAHRLIYKVTSIMTLTLLIFDLEVTNLVISVQITIGLSLNLVHMYKIIKEDGSFFLQGESLFLHLQVQVHL